MRRRTSGRKPPLQQMRAEHHELVADFPPVRSRERFDLFGHVQPINRGVGAVGATAQLAWSWPIARNRSHTDRGRTSCRLDVSHSPVGTVVPATNLVIRVAPCFCLVMGARSGSTALHVNSSETFQILAVRFHPLAFLRPDKPAVGVWQAPPKTTQFQTILEALEKPHGEQRRRW